MSISLTIFKNKFDNKTHKRMDLSSFGQFEEMLRKMSTRNKYKKEDAQLISPAVYKPGELRRNINVTHWAGWACLDIDDWPVENVEEAVQEKFGTYNFVCYSTASSTRELPKFRVIIELDRWVEVDDIPRLWYALSELSGNHADKQVKDMSRMYYIPANYRTSNASHQFYFSKLDAVQMNTREIMERYPMPESDNKTIFSMLPPHMQEAILERKKDHLTKTNFGWTSYRDCPFWPKKLAQEYVAITTTGWYHKLYQMMVSIASNAMRRGYPITPAEIATLIREFDAGTGGWYQDRPLEEESQRAIEFVFANVI